MVPLSRLRALAEREVSKIVPPMSSLGPWPHGIVNVVKTLLVRDRPLILSSEMPGPSSANCRPSGVNAG